MTECCTTTQCSHHIFIFSNISNFRIDKKKNLMKNGQFWYCNFQKTNRGPTVVFGNWKIVLFPLNGCENKLMFYLIFDINLMMCTFHVTPYKCICFKTLPQKRCDCPNILYNNIVNSVAIIASMVQICCHMNTMDMYLTLVRLAVKTGVGYRPNSFAYFLFKFIS